MIRKTVLICQAKDTFFMLLVPISWALANSHMMLIHRTDVFVIFLMQSVYLDPVIDAAQVCTSPKAALSFVANRSATFNKMRFGL